MPNFRGHVKADWSGRRGCPSLWVSSHPQTHSVGARLPDQPPDYALCSSFVCALYAGWSQVVLKLSPRTAPG
jgi:hypothetical protein